MLSCRVAFVVEGDEASADSWYDGQAYDIRNLRLRDEVVNKDLPALSCALLSIWGKRRGLDERSASMIG